jgi:hypothetical protein
MQLKRHVSEYTTAHDVLMMAFIDFTSHALVRGFYR